MIDWVDSMDLVWAHYYEIGTYYKDGKEDLKSLFVGNSLLMTATKVPTSYLIIGVRNE